MKHSLELLTTDRAWVCQTILENRRQLERNDVAWLANKLRSHGGIYLPGAEKSAVVYDLLIIFWGLDNVQMALNWKH